VVVNTGTTARQEPLLRRALLAIVLAALVLVLLIILGSLMWRRRRRGPNLEAARTRRLASPPGGLTGYTFGPYEIVGKLGSGGMATTYRARRSSDGKEVALKIPHDTCLEDETFRKRFLREGALGAQLHHPNLVRIIEASEDHGMPFIVMELVRGVTLRDVLAMTGQLPLDRALDLTRQTAEALDYAHSKGVIHRDLKPENLMVLPDNRLMVMDFGIARVEGGGGLTSTSVVMGTPAYTAPESLAREPVDHRADLYALGMILFEMLEGAGPFPGANPLEQLQAHLEGKFPDRSELARPLPDAIWNLILRLVARNPDDRFPGAEALLVELGAIIRDVEEGHL
jgi:serine/threonine-protein kinase